MDKFFANQKYIILNTCAQIFTEREGFVYLHSMKSKSQAVEALNVTTRNIGVPNTLISDNTGEHTGPHTELHEFIRCYCICGRTTEPYSHWQNRSEGMIKT